jgi:UTP--glucose-1-phosphate uridylyltransferase
MLPATQVTAKELLPVYDRPVIQFAIDEAIEAGAERIIVVVSDTKPAIREFLGDVAIASTERGTARKGVAQAAPEIVYVTQDEPTGLGHAILCCKGLTLPGPFGIILPDDIIMGCGSLAEMAENYQFGHMIAAMKVPDHETCRYGIFALDGAATDISIPVSGMVEKPPQGTAPSSLAAVGRYILQPMIFDVLGHTPKGTGGELQLTDAIAIAAHSVQLTAFRFSGTRYDCGSHDGLLAASIARQAAVRAVRVNASLSMEHPSARPVKNGRSHSAKPARSITEPALHAS